MLLLMYLEVLRMQCRTFSSSQIVENINMRWIIIVMIIMIQILNKLTSLEILLTECRNLSTSFYVHMVWKCHSVNELENKNGLFLTVYELKNNFRYLIKQSSQKKTVLRELYCCIIEKFNGFNIARVEFSKKLRQPFRPVNLIHKPVKKCDDIVNCFFEQKVKSSF